MEELLRIENLSVEYRIGTVVAKAVNNLNITIGRGEAIGLVGESGAGKTTTALSILNLLPEKIGFIVQDNIFIHGDSILAMNERKLEEIRGAKISMIFQNPLTSLNPVFTVGHQIAMVLNKHRKMNMKQATEEAGNLFNMVGIEKYRLGDYPHQFSGGMRQRVGIAAVLACFPDLLIADEPTTALDVTIQAQIMELMKNMQNNYSTSLLMITHNLGIVAELCQRVAIMYSGEIIEIGTVDEVFSRSGHWYTVGLINAIPRLTGPRDKLISIRGNVANAQMPPKGCRFHPRCPHCSKTCETEPPMMTKINENHYVACWNIKGMS